MTNGAWVVKDDDPQPGSFTIGHPPAGVSELEVAIADVLNNEVKEALSATPPTDLVSQSQFIDDRTRYLQQLRRWANDLVVGKKAGNEGIYLLFELGKKSSEFYDAQNRLVQSIRETVRFVDSSTRQAIEIKWELGDVTSEQQAFLIDLERTHGIVQVVFERRLKKKRFGWVKEAAGRATSSGGTEEGNRASHVGEIGRQTNLPQAGSPKPPGGDDIVQRGPNTIGHLSQGTVSGMPKTHDLGEQELLRARYVRDLKSIADTALLSAAHLAFGTLRLEAFRAHFVNCEAEAVKNEHIKVLGAWTVGFCLVLLAAILAVHGLAPTVEMNDPLNGIAQTRNFLLLAGGAAVGTWLSFSLRRVNLSFTDLAIMEEDRLMPAARLIFVMLLTCALGLLIETDLMGIQIGGTPIEVTGGQSPLPLMPIALGVLCGIAERSLAGVVSQRAIEVVESGKTSAEAATQKQKGEL